MNSVIKRAKSATSSVAVRHSHTYVDRDSSTSRLHVIGAQSSALHLEIDNNREVIRGNERPAAAMHHDLHHIQRPLKVDVIEVHQWEKPRIGPGPSEQRTG